MRAASVIVLLLLSHSSFAVFQKIYQGYQKSDRLKEIKINKELVDVDYLIGENQFDWQLDLSANHTDSFLQRLFAFQSNQTISQSYGMALTRGSYKYGTVSLSHSQTVYDLSNWSNTSLSSFASDQVFESTNALTYTYQFLNQNLQLAWQEVVQQKTADELSYQIQEDQDRLEFFQAYLQAKLRIMREKLNIDFELRARRRVNQISTRVKDGLSRKVDLYSANLSLINQQEAVLQNQAELRESLAILENILKTQITKSDYKELDWSYKPSKRYPYISQTQKFKQVERLKILSEIVEINLTQMKEQAAHSLDLNLSYQKNAIDDEQSMALDESFGSGNNDEKIIGLVYSIPLGSTKNDAIKRKLLLQKNQNKLKLNNLQEQLKVQFSVLTENIERYESAIKLLKSKVRTANRIVNENQRYYTRGQVTFEETLQSEVNLINARVSEVNMLALYENALAQKAFLSGSLIKFLAEYKD